MISAKLPMGVGTTYSVDGSICNLLNLVGLYMLRIKDKSFLWQINSRKTDCHNLCPALSFGELILIPLLGG